MKLDIDLSFILLLIIFNANYNAEDILTISVFDSKSAARILPFF